VFIIKTDLHPTLL